MYFWPNNENANIYHALKLLVAPHFLLRLRHLQDMVLNSIFWRRKSLTTHFFLDVREQKEVLGGQVRAVRRMTNQFDILTLI